MTSSEHFFSGIRKTNYLWFVMLLSLQNPISTMKKFIYLLFIILFACQSKPRETANMVSVSILPQKYIVDQISGGLLQVNVLVPPGSSPHNYEVLPSQMKDLSKSKVWLQIGLLTFEDAWREKLAEINKDLVIVNCSDGIQLLAGSECEEGHDHEHGAVLILMFG